MVRLVRPGPRSTVPSRIDYGSSQATDQEIREAGRQRVRVVLWHILGGPSDKEGAHYVEAAMVPGWVGTSLVRTFQVDSSGQSILTRQVPGETDVLVCGAWWTMRPDGHHFGTRRRRER